MGGFQMIKTHLAVLLFAILVKRNHAKTDLQICANEDNGGHKKCSCPVTLLKKVISAFKVYQYNASGSEKVTLNGNSLCRENQTFSRNGRITKICNSGDLKYYVRENENCIENYKKIVLNKKGKILGTAYRKSSTDNGGSYSLIFEISKAEIQLNYICKDGQSFCEDENSSCHSRNATVCRAIKDWINPTSKFRRVLIAEMNGATQYYSRVKYRVESCEVKDLKHTLSDSRIVEFDNYSHKKNSFNKRCCM